MRLVQLIAPALSSPVFFFGDRDPSSQHPLTQNDYPTVFVNRWEHLKMPTPHGEASKCSHGQPSTR